MTSASESISSGLARRLLRPVEGAVRRLVGSVAAVATDDRVLHLTFDDGPHPHVTPAILSVLDDCAVPATFFATSGRAEAHPEIVQAAVAAGHEIGLHSHSHPRLPEVGLGVALDEVWRARRRLDRIVGRRVRLFRPPYGAQDLRTRMLAWLCRMRVVLWSAECPDWLPHPIEDQVAFAVKTMRPGRIVLLHDVPPEGPGGPDKATLVRSVIDAAVDEGFRFVSLETLLTSGKPHRKVSLQRRRRR